jgi:hypothetical protein
MPQETGETQQRPENVEKRGATSWRLVNLIMQVLLRGEGNPLWYHPGAYPMHYMPQPCVAPTSIATLFRSHNGHISRISKSGRRVLLKEEPHL